MSDMTTRTWRRARFVELMTGYEVRDRDGRSARRVTDVEVACVGGFLHVAVGGDNPVQIVSAPAVRLIELRDGKEV
jgi:hypothetical protein